MNDRVKLLKFVPSFGVAGMERQVVSLALALDPNRYAVRFGCTNRWGQLLADIEAREIPVRQYRVGSFRHPRALAAAVRFANDVRRERIPIVHSYGFYSNVFAVPAAKLAGARTIASIRDMGVYLTSRQRTAQRLICRLADRILVNAGAIRDWLVSDGYDASKISVIPNGIDLVRFGAGPDGQLRASLGVPPDAPLIGVVGRVARMKGLDDFIRAAAIVRDRHPQARFVVAGDSGTFVRRGTDIVEVDDYERELREMIRDLGLTDRFFFVGFRPDVERVLADLTISVQPSLSEGLSNTLIESMAAGRAIVATRVGGAPEVIRPGVSGLLVAPGTSDALSAAVCQLLENHELAATLGANARRFAHDHFSMARVAERTSEIYEEVLAGRRAPIARATLDTV